MKRSDPQLLPLFSESEIQYTVKRLAMEIDKDYSGHDLVVVGVMKGAFVFLADLLRHLKVPVQRLELIWLASYGSATDSSGEVKVLQDLAPHGIHAKDVLIVEDIVDSGHSIARAMMLLETCRPASIRLCALLDKPERREVPVHISYLGLTVPDRFVVGYGMDWDEKYRELPSIQILHFPSKSQQSS